MERARRASVGLLLGTVGAGLAVKAWLVVARPLWADEIFTLDLARRGVSAVLAALKVDSGPPLHYLVTHLLLLPFPAPGPADALVRVLSALLALAHVPLLLAIGRRLGAVERGALAAVLLSAGPIAAYFATEGRGYALASLLLLASFERLLALREVPTAPRALAAGVLAGAAFLSHYLAAFPLVGLATLLRGTSDRARRSFLLAGTVAAALVAPWVPTLLAQPRASMAWVVPEPPLDRIARLLLNSVLGFDLPGEGVLFPAAAALLVLLVAVRASRVGDPVAPAFLVALGLQGAAGLLEPRLLLPERSAFLLLPLAALVVASAGRVVAGAVAVVGAVFLAMQAPGWTRESPQEMVAGYLLPAARSGARIVAVGLLGPELDYRLTRSGVSGAVASFPSEVERHPGWYDDAALPAERLAAEAAARLAGPDAPRFLVLPKGLSASEALRRAAGSRGGRTLGASPWFEVVELLPPPPG